MFISVTLHDEANPREDVYEGAPPPDSRSGAIMEVEYDPDTGSLRRTGNDVLLDQCDEAHGIAVSDDCSRVGVLCQRYDHASTTEPFDADLTEGVTSWITQPDNVAVVDANPNVAEEDREGSYRSNGEMWLLEWNDGAALNSDPSAYVIHKAISGSHLGNHSLLYSDEDDTYAASMFAAVFDGGGGRHSGDAFLVIDRVNWTINGDRGWTWQCAKGHTLHNRPVFHPDTGQYYGVCTSDWTFEEQMGAGFWVKAETSSSSVHGRQFFVTWGAQSRAWGGTHAFLPVADGLLGTVVAHPDAGFGAPPAVVDDMPLQIGLVSMGDDEMDLRTLRWMRWVASSPDHFLGHPQLAQIGDDRFLLGYAEMHRVHQDEPSSLDFQVPWSHSLQEIDGEGNLIGEPTALEGVGWGEQDQWISLGGGQGRLGLQ